MVDKKLHEKDSDTRPYIYRMTVDDFAIVNVALEDFECAKKSQLDDIKRRLAKAYGLNPIHIELELLGRSTDAVYGKSLNYITGERL